MNNKKAAIIIIAILLAPLLANLAFAEGLPISTGTAGASSAQGAQPGAVQTVLQVFVDNFGFLLNPQAANMALYVKLLFALVIILPIYYLLAALFKGNKAIPGILAFAIGMISMMAIPNQIIGNLVSVYGGIATVILYILPIAAIFFIYNFIDKTVEERSRLVANVLKIVVCAVGFYYTLNIRTVLQTTKAFADILGTGWISYVLFILGLFMLFAALALLGIGGQGRWNPANWNLPRRGGGGGITPISLAGGGGGRDVIPQGTFNAGTPVVSTADTQRVAQIMSDIERADNEFLNNINAIKSLAPEELQTLTGIRTALENVSDGIDSTKAVYLSALAYRSAAIPEAEKTAGIERINQNLRQKSAQMQEYLNQVSEGFSKINADEGEKGKTLENYERVEGDKVKKDIQQLYATIEEWRTIAKEDIGKNQNVIETISTQFAAPPSGKTTEDLSHELETLRKTNEKYSNLMAELDSLKNKEVKGLENSFTLLLRTIAMAHSNIETFKKMITNDTDKISSAVQQISKEGAIEQDFKNASSSIRAIANDEIPKMEQDLKQNSEAVNVIGGEVATAQTNVTSLAGRITQLIEEKI